MTTLYLGLELPQKPLSGKVIHFPIIKIVPKPLHDPAIASALSQICEYTHIVLTSKVSARLFFNYLLSLGNSLDIVKNKSFIVVGKATAGIVAQYGIAAISPEDETSEGVAALLQTLPWQDQFLLWWHSALSRNVLKDFLQLNAIRHCDCIAYNTVPNDLEPFPEWDNVDHIIFTSPSTVNAFVSLFGSIPFHKKITPIGPITAARLQQEESKFRNGNH